MKSWLIAIVLVLTACNARLHNSERDPSSVTGEAFSSDLCVLSLVKIFRPTLSTQIVDVMVSGETIEQYFPKPYTLKPSEHRNPLMRQFRRSIQSPPLSQYIRRTYMRNGPAVFAGAELEEILEEERLYSYSIRYSGVVSFGKSGSQVNDLISKHVIISNGERSVAFAGEIMLDNGILFISNGSGSYRPEKELLPIVEGFFRNELGFSGRIVLFTNEDNLVELVKKTSL